METRYLNDLLSAVYLSSCPIIVVKTVERRVCYLNSTPKHLCTMTASFADLESLMSYGIHD